MKTEKPLWPEQFSMTGRLTSDPPEMHPCFDPAKPRGSYEGPTLDHVDLAAVEMRLMAFTFPRQCGKTEALKAMQDGNIADFYKAMGVPFEHLGKDRDDGIPGQPTES